MYVRRRIRLTLIWRFAWRNLLFFGLWAAVITALEVWLKAHHLSLSLL